MSKELYHIECSQTEAICHITGLLDKQGIENYVGNGGVHIHCLPEHLEFTVKLAKVFSKTLEKGMLPKVKQSMDSMFKNFPN